jgi:hypothetical protein
MRIRAEGLCEMLANPWRYQRMCIGNRHQGQRARVGALPRVGRDQPRFGLDVLDIFDDGERLKHRMPVMNEGRHHTLGVDGVIAGLELLTG